jgi:hypothetical protein
MKPLMGHTEHGDPQGIFDGSCVGDQNQRISVDDAIRICTINGAYASFEEKTSKAALPLASSQTSSCLPRILTT